MTSRLSERRVEQQCVLHLMIGLPVNWLLTCIQGLRQFMSQLYYGGLSDNVCTDLMQGGQQWPMQNKFKYTLR